MVKILSTLTIFIFSLNAGGVCHAQYDLAAHLDKNLAGVAGYQYGSSRLALTELEEIVREVLNRPGAREIAENKFIAFLKSDATLAGKQFVCRKLSVVGSEASTPVLREMLQNEATFDMALYALERIPGKGVDEAVRAAAGQFSGAQKVGLIAILGLRRDEDAVPMLGELINDGDIEIAAAAVSSLGVIANAGAAKILFEAIGTTSGELRTEVLRSYLRYADALVSRGQGREAKSLYPEYIKLVYPDAVRSAALSGVLRTNPGLEKEIILGALRGDDAEMKSTALFHLGRLPSINNVWEIAAELPNLESQFQIQMLAALASRGERSVLQQVSEATSYENLYVRIAALQALASLGDASSVDLLCKFAAKGGPEMETARESLYGLPGESVDNTIVSRLSSADPITRIELLIAMAERNMVSAADKVLPYAEDADPQVRRQAIKTLGLLPDPHYLPEMVEVLVRAPNNGERVEAEKTVLAMAMARDAGEDRSAELIAALPTAASLEAKSSLLAVLGKIGDRSALPEIRSALGNKDTGLQKAGIRALSGWPNAEPIDDLLDLATNAADRTVQILGLRSAIGLIGADKAVSDEQKTAMYTNILDMSPELNEKRMVLSGLAALKTKNALEIAAAYLDDPELQREAESAVVEISERLAATQGAVLLPYLERVVQSTKTEKIREKAEAVINEIKR